MAANTFLGTTNSNWGTSTNWSTLAVPTAGDGNVATFTNLSPACTVDASSKVCNGIDFTGYTNTITMSFNISVSGNITLGFGVGGGASGAGILIAHTAGNLTSSGKIWNGTLRFDASVTYTLIDDWNVVTLQPGNGVVSPVINGAFKINMTGNLDLSVISSGTCSGTAEFVMTGTGNLLVPSSTGVLRNNTTINTAGSIAFPTGTFRFNTGTLTWTAGTITNSSNTDLISILSTNFNTGGAAMPFKSFAFSGTTQTWTFNSDFYVGDLLPQTATAVNSTLNGASADIYVSGNITITNTTTGRYAGTLRTIYVTGATPTLSSSLTTGLFQLPLHINTTGTVTITSGFNLDLSKFSDARTGVVVTDTTWAIPAGMMKSRVFTGF